MFEERTRINAIEKDTSCMEREAGKEAKINREVF
jgi:hypothetical protein